MKSRFAVFLVTLFLLFTWLASSFATVEWDVAGTLNLKEKPRDAAMALNGKWIFVLTEKGGCEPNPLASFLQFFHPHSVTILTV